jgi:hypothetical protein
MKRRAGWRSLFGWLGLLLVALVQGCRCGSTGVDTRRFACTDDTSCASGFVCRAGECQRELAAPGDEDSGLPDVPDAGSAGDAGSAEDAGGTEDAGSPDGGGDGAQATQLAFVGTSAGAEAGACASEVLETRNAAGRPVAVDAATTVQLSVQPERAVGFFQDASCKTALTSVVIAPGASRATFSFRGTVAQSVRLTATATGLGAAGRDELIRAAAPSRLAFVPTSGQTVASGSCSAGVVLEARDAYGNPATFTSAQSVLLSGSNLSFYTDTTCGTPLSSPQFAAGTSRLTFAFKGRGNGTVQLSALASGLGLATQTQTLRPTTRAGSCIFRDGSTSLTCTISPAQIDLTHTLLFFQASPPGTSPDASSVRCRISALDAITCGRNSSEDDIYVTWYTAELPGAKVQNLEAQCAGGSITSVVPASAVSLANTFLLTSGEVSGKALGDDDFATVTLATNRRVDYQFTTSCAAGWKSWLQLVESPSLQVTRGTTGAMTNLSLTVSNLSRVNLGTTALLFTYRVSNTGSANLCDRMLNARLASDTSITFTRGAGNNYRCDTAVIDAISWERIDFGSLAQVQQVPVSLGSGTSTSTGNLSPSVDTSRTVLFASGQVLGGQAGGDASYPNGTPLGAALGWFEFTDTAHFSVERERTEGNVNWTVNAVQFDP